MAGGAPATTPDPTSLTFFHSQANTRPIVSDPHYTPIPTSSRMPKHETSEDSFYATTLATQHTVPHLLTLRLKNPPPIPISKTASSSPSEYISGREPETLSLCHINHIGSSGHPRTAHGGLLTTIIDEVWGVLLAYYQKKSTYTATMTIDFVAPVRLPGTIICRSWVERGDGNRKWWCRCEVVHWVPKEGGDDKEGAWEVCTRGHGLFLEVKEKL